MKLNNGQIKSLRAEGHRLNLKPVIIIGQKGMSENLAMEIDNALTHHELLKIRIPGLDKNEKRALAAQICEQHAAELIELIGNVIVIFRRNKDSERFAAFQTG